MQYEGVLTKMQTEFGDPIQYYLVFEDSFLNVNQLLDKNLEISFEIVSLERMLSNCCMKL